MAVDGYYKDRRKSDWTWKWKAQAQGVRPDQSSGSKVETEAQEAESGADWSVTGRGTVATETKATGDRRAEQSRGSVESREEARWSARKRCFNDAGDAEMKRGRLFVLPERDLVEVEVVVVVVGVWWLKIRALQKATCKYAKWNAVVCMWTNW